ncbi:MAG TPA: methyltransferase [Polyangiaceae bacterium]|nr:methyltransferase [Polyangiaceae bacterium]
MNWGFDIDPSDGARLFARLRSLGFVEESVRSRLGLDDLNDLKLRAAPIYRAERLETRDPLASAIDLWLLQGALPLSELKELFDAPTERALRTAGLLSGDERTVRARASLFPVGEELVFADHASHELDPSAAETPQHDRVMYIGTDSRWLARVTFRKPILSALDLCTGSGIHALLAARHAARVTAVDVNPRALACTRFNARLRGVTNLDALEGDLYAPVGERRFELITANPPFVPAPSQLVGFRDGGPSGEDVQRRIVEGLPRYLAPGGVAQIVTELGENDDAPLERRLRAWLGDAPLDIHVLRLRAHAAETYALAHAEGDSTADFLQSVGLWAANLRVHGYRRVVSVLITFRWSDGAPWSRVDSARPPTRNAGAELAAIFASERLARAQDLPERLRAERVVRTGPVAVFESRAFGAELAPSITVRSFGRALSVEHALSPLELGLLANTERPVTVDALRATAGGSSDDELVTALVSLVSKGLVGLAATSGT